MHLFKFLITSSFLLYALAAQAQISQQKDTLTVNSKGFASVEIEASYPGGVEAWRNFLQKNLKPNTPIKNKAPMGKYTAVVLFIVDKDGSTSNVRAETNYGYGMEDEVIRVIEQSGKWTPATRNGEPLRAFRRQPVTFLVTDDGIEILSQEQYTLFTNVDNEIGIKVNKIKPADISINVQGGKVTPLAEEGKFNVRVSKPGRIIIEIVNTKKDDKVIGVASFEVKEK